MQDSTPRTLWQQLLAGQVTEVCMLTNAGELRRLLPQALGLGVIDYETHKNSAHDPARAEEQRVRIARELAAQPGWIAVGGPRYWVLPFAERAQVILLTALDPLAPLTTLRPRRQQPPEPYSWAEDWQRRTRRLATGRVSAWEYTGDGPVSAAAYAAYLARMRLLLSRTFPHKTLILRSREHVKRLRSVSAHTA